jgi:hypothetical protein
MKRQFPIFESWLLVLFGIIFNPQYIFQKTKAMPIPIPSLGGMAQGN